MVNSPLCKNLSLFLYYLYHPYMFTILHNSIIVLYFYKNTSREARLWQATAPVVYAPNAGHSKADTAGVTA